MTPAATTAAPESTASDSHLSERAKHYRHILGEIVDLGGVFLRMTVNDTAAARQEARDSGEKAVMPDYVGAYERLTTSIRRSIILDLSLDKPAQPIQLPRATREQAERALDAAVVQAERPEQPTPPERAERAERAEDAERPEQPETLERIQDEDLSHLPTDEAIAIIRRDLPTNPAEPAAQAAPKPAAPTPSQQLRAMLQTVGKTMQANQQNHHGQGPPPPNIGR